MRAGRPETGAGVEIRVDGKIALVTGSTQGIGLAVAEGLIGSGAAGVLLTGRDIARGQAAAARLNAGFVAADLADPETPSCLIDACMAKFGRIDILVNAAGLTDRAGLVDATLADWDHLFTVNTRAPFFLMQGAVAAMRRQGGGGAIVNILSMNVHCGAPNLAVYSGSKAALATLTRSAANAHRADRIRVNGINMGWTDTPAERRMQADVLGLGIGWLDEAERKAPFGRLLKPADIASLAVFLASDAAGPMTGALIDQEQWVLGGDR